jgi:hypothetical protein
MVKLNSHSLNTLLTLLPVPPLSCSKLLKQAVSLAPAGPATVIALSPFPPQPEIDEAQTGCCSFKIGAGSFTLHLDFY